MFRRWRDHCPVMVHILLREPQLMPVGDGMEVHALRLPSRLQSVLERLARIAMKDPVRKKRDVSYYLVKAFLPWLLPPHITRCLLIDYADFFFTSSPCALWTQHLQPATRLAMVADVAGAVLYPRSPLQPNSGLILMELQLLRQEPAYLQELERHNQSVGDLADQTLFAQLSVRKPSLFEHLSCRWNRQLNMHTPVPSARYACDGCDGLHTNGVRIKWLARALQRNGSCAPLRELALHLRNSDRKTRVLLTTTAAGCCGFNPPSRDRGGWSAEARARADTHLPRAK